MELLRKYDIFGSSAAQSMGMGGAADASSGILIPGHANSFGNPEGATKASLDQARELRKSKALQADEAIFERVARDRCEIAFSELYDRFSGRVYALLVHMLRVEEDAQDLLQEIFIIIWHKAPTFLESRGNVAAWILSIARNRAVDEMRSKKFRDRRLEDELVTGEDRPELEALIENNFSADAEITAREAHEDLQRALRSLTQEQRTVVDLAYFGGLSHTEISEKLSMPMGSVKSKMRQAVIRMSKVLKPKG